MVQLPTFIRMQFYLRTKNILDWFAEGPETLCVLKLSYIHIPVNLPVTRILKRVHH